MPNRRNAVFARLLFVLLYASPLSAQVVTGETIVWVQPDADLSGLGWQLAVDGIRQDLAPTCYDPSPFLCTAPKPLLTPGPHSLVLVAKTGSEERASAPYLYTQLPPTPPPPVVLSSLTNINTATASELAQVPYARLGATLAGRIVSYRTANGPFKSIAELAKVAGISASMLTLITPAISVAAGSVTPTPVVPDACSLSQNAEGWTVSCTGLLKVKTP